VCPAAGVRAWPLIGWEKTAVIGWSRRLGGGARASSRRGALCVVCDLARPCQNPNLQMSPPLSPEVRVRVRSGKKCRRAVVSSFIGRGGRGARLVLYYYSPTLNFPRAAPREQSMRRVHVEASNQRGEQSTGRAECGNRLAALTGIDLSVV
jgi:hypothetical protein